MHAYTIPGTVKMVILLMIQLYVTIDFKKGRVSWSNHVSLLKTVFPTWLQKGKSEIWSTRFHMPLLPWRWRRPHGKECRCPLGAESSPRLKTSKEMLTSVLKLQKKPWILPTTRLSFKANSSLDLQREAQPCWYLAFSLWNPEWDSSLAVSVFLMHRNYEIISVYYFKSLR